MQEETAVEDFWAELRAPGKESGLEKLPCGTSMWVVGSQDQQAGGHLGVEDRLPSWWPSAGSLPSPQPFLSFPCPDASESPEISGGHQQS